MTLPYLTQKMVLESVVRNPDGAGGYVEDWVALGQLWFEVKVRYGGMDRSGVSSVDYVLTTRSAPVGAPSRPRAGQRLKAEGQTYLIEAVAEAKDHKGYLSCFAVEEVAP